MILFRDVVCRLDKEHGCSVVSLKLIESTGPVLLAKGGGRSAPSVQNVTQNSAPWAAQQPYLTQGFERAKTDILNTPQTFFPGQTYANFSPQTIARNWRRYGAAVAGPGNGNLSDAPSGRAGCRHAIAPVTH